jgi:hypothetical protein
VAWLVVKVETERGLPPGRMLRNIAARDSHMRLHEH